MCFTEIIKINPKSIKQIIVYEIFVTDKVIKRKLIIVILKKNTEEFLCTGFIAKFFWMR